MKVKYNLLDPKLAHPAYAQYGDAGFDLRSRINCEVLPNNRLIIPTGLVFEIPYGYEGQIRSRSGLAAKYGIKVLNSPGTLDHGYRGEVMVILHNVSTEVFSVKKGDRIAQLVVAKVELVELIPTEDELSSSDRGTGGLGSTGIK